MTPWSCFFKTYVRSSFVNKPRPVLINNWEATYFEFTEEKILQLAQVASRAGIELFVLDDGWFGKRNNDESSLGDWKVNLDKLPNGLNGLAERINELGMKFGLWFEPEMISIDSDLYREHPDWAIHIEGRLPIYSREQLVLDLTKQEVCDYIIDSVSSILKSANITYVKWDMNRNITNIPEGLANDQCFEFHHRYMLGLYRVLDTPPSGSQIFFSNPVQAVEVVMIWESCITCHKLGQVMIQMRLSAYLFKKVLV